MKIKKIINMEAVFTVEASLIIIFIFAVIFLEIFFSFFLHDKIIMEDLITEAAMTSDEIDYTDLQQKAENLTLCLNHIEFVYQEGFIKDKITYNAIVKIPLSGIIGVLLKQSEFRISGKRDICINNPYQFLCSCGK